MCRSISCQLVVAVSVTSFLHVVAVVAKTKRRDSLHPSVDAAVAVAVAASSSGGTAGQHSRNYIHAVESTTTTRQPKSDSSTAPLLSRVNRRSVPFSLIVNRTPSFCLQSHLPLMVHAFERGKEIKIEKNLPPSPSR